MPVRYGFGIRIDVRPKYLVDPPLIDFDENGEIITNNGDVVTMLEDSLLNDVVNNLLPRDINQ